MRVQQDPKLISGEGKARKRDPWRVAMIRLEACQRKQHWKEERSRIKEKKRVKGEASLLAINVTLMVFEPSVPHFLCSFFEKKH